MPATMDQTSQVQACARIIVANAHAPGTARMFARALFGDDTENLQLVLSELVSNAVQAARGSSIGVSLQPVSGAVLCEVCDDNPSPPAPRNPAPEDLSGRGLMIVDAIALKWDWRPVANGKVVRAIVRG